MAAAPEAGGAPMPDDSRPLANGVRRHFRALPPSARVLWWGARPLFLAGALVFAVIEIDSGGGLLRGLAGAAIAVGVRTIRRPWVGLIAAGIVGLLVPGIGLMMIGRTLAGTSAIMIAGHGWRDGLENLVRSRRLIVDGTLGVDDALVSLAGLHQMNENEALDAIVKAAVAAWATADGLRMATMVMLFVRLLHRGRAGPIQLPWDLTLWRLALIESLTELVPRLSASLFVVLLILAAGSGLLPLSPVFALDGGPLRIGLVCALAALMAQNLAKVRHDIPIGKLLSFLLPLGYGVALAFVLGTDLWPVLIFVLVAVVLARIIYAGLAGRMIGSSPQRMRLPRGTGSLAGREKWRAALEALRSPNSTVPEQLWTQIHAESRESAGFRAGAAAALADVALRANNLQRALDWADQAQNLLGDEAGSSMAPHVWAVRGRVLLAVGETNEARGLLEQAVTSRLYRSDERLLEDIERADAGAEPQADSVGGQRGVRRNLAGELRTNIDKAVREGDIDRLQEMLAWSDDDIDIDDDAARRALRDTVASGRVELGALELRRGRPVVAATVLRRATGVSDPGVRAVARTLLGVAMATSVPHRAMTELTAGVRALEQRRGTLSQGQLRGRLIANNAAIYEQVFGAIEQLQQHGVSADLAGEVIESLRRGSLATMLRTGMAELGGPLTHLAQRLADLESVGTDGTEAAIAAIRADLGLELSVVAAEAYAPEPVQYDELRAAMAGQHVLAFHLYEAGPDRVRGVAIWTSASGSTTMQQVDIANADLLDILGTRGEDRRHDVMDAPQDAEARDSWRRLGMALLPQGLRTVLNDTTEANPVALVIVPDGPLTALPWAALRLDDGRPLLAAAQMQQIPSLGLLGPPRRTSDAGTRTVALYLADGVASGRERRALDNLPTDLATTPESFADALARGPAGAYLAAHGEDVGLAQAVRFSDGSVLSAAAAIAHQWPSWVVFASCLVGRIQLRLGDEPLGMAISCLISGAQTVVGGVIDVSYSAGVQAARVAILLDKGEHPAIALRQEQLQQFHADKYAPLSAWASLVCITRLRHPERDR